MKPISSSSLLEGLETDTRQLIVTLHYLLQEDPALLVQQPAPGKWSVAQVIEHLNIYGRYYLPIIEKKMKAASYPANASFTPGWLGDQFTKSMKPKEDGSVRNKMKAFKSYSPTPDIDSFTVLNEFMAQEKKLLNLLADARKTDMGRVMIPVSIARFIRMKLGDTFRFLIAHHQRHFVQISRTIEAVKKNHGYSFPGPNLIA